MKNIKVFKPSKDEMLKAMNEVAQFMSDDKVLGSNDHPELKVRGKQKTKWKCGGCGKSFGKDDILIMIPDNDTEYEGCNSCFEKWQSENR